MIVIYSKNIRDKKAFIDANYTNCHIFASIKAKRKLIKQISNTKWQIDHCKYLPIPQTEIEKTDGDFKLVQNPGY